MKEIKLFEHNQIIVNEIEKAMNEGMRKIFFTEATGLGKSFVFMYLINKHFKNKRVLYICPTYHIWKNMNMYKEFSNIKHCVDVCCYADFNEIKAHHYDYDVYFIDEAHHLFSDVQGKNIVSITNHTIKKNKNAYIFGMTATPYFEGKMVGDAFFDVSIVGKNILEAIEEKLLQPINYAIAIDDVVKNREVRHYMKEMKNIAKKYNVDTTKTTIRSVMNEFSHINHWLLYFPRIQELEDDILYFNKYFPEYKIFILHSKVDDMENVLDEFESYEGKAILASVSMILEGVHPRTIGGILSYRNTYSYNLFLQMIGRLGIMNRDISPVFIDIYKSYDNIKPPQIGNTMTGYEEFHIDKSKNSECEISERIRKCVLLHTSTYELIKFSDILENIYKQPQHVYRSIVWTCDEDLSRKLGKHIGYVCYYKHKGLSYEEIIDQVLDYKQDVKTYRGFTWRTEAELCEKLGKSCNYLCKFKAMGLTIEQIIDKVLDYKSNEYRGITWNTDKELSIKLSKNDFYVNNCKRRGMTYEEIIDQVLDLKPSSHSYRGITWMTNAELSRKLGMSNTYVSLYRRNGLSYEEIIDRILDKFKTYRGVTWSTDNNLSRKLGKCDRYVVIQRHKGLSYEEIIDKVLDCKPDNNSYRGIIWISDQDLSRKLGKSENYVCHYKSKGLSYEEIIDKVLDKKDEKDK